MHINSQLILVIGGGSGLGAATAQFLAENGAKVAVLDINQAQAEKVANTINGLALHVDVTQTETIEVALTQVAHTFNQPIRACVNCAGIVAGKRIVGKDEIMPLTDFEHVIRINLIGTFNILRLVSAHMSTQIPLATTQERGVIINTSSIAAEEGQIGQCAYSASKGGVSALTLPAARELARFGIRVMAIAPGVFATPMMLSMPEEVQASLSAQVPFPQTLGDPKTFAQLAAHIIENHMLNGAVLRLDGGLRMAAN